MLPSRGFEEGFVGQGRCGGTGAGGHGKGGVTCSTSHPHASNETVTSQASQSMSHHMDTDYMHVVQSGPAYGDSNSLASSSDVDSACAGATSDTLGPVDSAEAAHVGEVVHNGVHYYVDVPNSEENAYQACNRKVQIDPKF